DTAVQGTITEYLLIRTRGGTRTGRRRSQRWEAVASGTLVFIFIYFFFIGITYCDSAFVLCRRY
ncbi:MAG TPA: hypothetical protein VHA52_07410, partial [Candidatus Babeliaceae bacterium]|nr:hypothetical protein [Candidatus Babeliaceae bacterium]